LISRSRSIRFGRRARGFASVALASLAASGCTDWAGYDLDYLMGRTAVLATMRSTVSFDPQSFARLPVPGTVPFSSPVGELLPPFTQAQLDSVAATLTSPLQPTPDVLSRGAYIYSNQCFACHGEAGAGNGPVVGAGKFPLGPVLNGGTAAARSDGYLYAIIRVGRGLMPPYGDRVSHDDRWALVHYLRQLQGQSGALTAPAAATPAAGAAGAAQPGAPQPAGAQPAGTGQ
jgi:mono/diheme cytochrome c family protein